MGFTARYGFAAVFLLLVGPLLRASEEEGALNAIQQFSRSSFLGEGEAVLGLVGFYGDPLPPQWLILSSVKGKPGVLKESVFSKGKVVAERRFQKLPGQDLPGIPIRIDEVRVDAMAAFSEAEAAAAKRKVAFDSVHYQLRCREMGREPIWMLSLLNRAQVVVGVVYISALNGDRMQESWPLLEPGKLTRSLEGS